MFLSPVIHILDFCKFMTIFCCIDQCGIVTLMVIVPVIKMIRCVSQLFLMSSFYINVPHS